MANKFYSQIFGDDKDPKSFHYQVVTKVGDGGWTPTGVTEANPVGTVYQNLTPAMIASGDISRAHNKQGGKSAEPTICNFTLTKEGEPIVLVRLQKIDAPPKPAKPVKVKVEKDPNAPKKVREKATGAKVTGASHASGAHGHAPVAAEQQPEIEVQVAGDED